MRAFAIACLFALAPPLAAAVDGQYEVHVTHSDGEALLTVHARSAPVEALMLAVADELGRELTGFDRTAETAPVTVYVDERPANSAIHWILGSAGLRAALTGDSIHVTDDTTPYPRRGEVLDLAEIAFLRALRNHPEHTRAARSELALAEIQESRGELVAAIHHYDYLVERSPDSELVPEAMIRSGRHLATLGQWGDAAQRFGELAHLDVEHPYHSIARVELARALTYAGRAKQALHMLDSLEAFYPTDDMDAREERLIVRARALAESGEPIEAMRALDLAADYTEMGGNDPRILEIRALATAATGRYGEAAVAWMRYARAVEGDLRAAGLAAAVRHSLDAGDELGVLFIHAWAERVGAGNATRREASEARARLGLPTPSVLAVPAEERLTRAENLYSRGLVEEARDALSALYARRAALDEDQRVRLAVAFTRTLEDEGSIERAVTVLREVARSLQSVDRRKQVYIHASEMFERRGRLDEALEALRGQL